MGEGYVAEEIEYSRLAHAQWKGGPEWAKYRLVLDLSASTNTPGVRTESKTKCRTARTIQKL